MKETGQREKSPQGKPIFGFTETETVKLDFDDVSFKTVKYWAKRGYEMVQTWFFVFVFPDSFWSIA